MPLSFVYKTCNIQKCHFYLIEITSTCTRCISTFFIWTRLLNHNKYVEIKQCSKEDINQNNISTVILIIKCFIYARDPRHLHRSRDVYIFVYIKSVFYLISNHIFINIKHKDTFYSDNKWCVERFNEFADEKLKVQIENRFIYSMN